MSNVFDEIAEEARDLTAAPSDQQLASIREKCVELVELEKSVKDAEKSLTDLKEKKNALAHKELPDLFAQMDMSSFGLSEANVDCIMTPYFKASIPADWEDDDKSVAFDHLDQIGGGDIVRTEVKFTLGRGQMDLAKTLVASIRMLGQAMEDEGLSDLPEPSISMGVPWNTLTSFVKERYNKEASEEFLADLQEAQSEGRETKTMDLKVLNATAGHVVKIKERK